MKYITWPLLVLPAIILVVFTISGCMLPDTNLPTCQTIIETYFPRAGEDPATVLIDLYNGATSSVDVAIYSFTHPAIGGALTAAVKRGVKVRVITSSDQLAGSTIQKDLLAGLLAAGALIRVDTHSGLMHLKMSIIDRQSVASGSYNYSNSASNSNDEVMMVIRDQVVVKECLTEFERMWTAVKGYKDYVP